MARLPRWRDNLTDSLCIVNKKIVNTCYSCYENGTELSISDPKRHSVFRIRNTVTRESGEQLGVTHVTVNTLKLP
jgi:hypothetical protein